MGLPGTAQRISHFLEAVDRAVGTSGTEQSQESGQHTVTDGLRTTEIDEDGPQSSSARSSIYSSSTKCWCLFVSTSNLMYSIIEIRLTSNFQTMRKEYVNLRTTNVILNMDYVSGS